MYNQKLNNMSDSVRREELKNEYGTFVNHPYIDTNAPTEPDVYVKSVNLNEQLNNLKTFNSNQLELFKCLLNASKVVSETQNGISDILAKHTKILENIEKKLEASSSSKTTSIDLATTIECAKTEPCPVAPPPSPRTTPRASLEPVLKKTSSRPKLRIV